MKTTNDMLLHELEEPAARLLDHHLQVTKPWKPYMYIPFTDAQSFGGPEGVPWDPYQYPLSDGVRSAILVNLLTEDNLPYYTHTILSQAKPGHPLDTWTRQWTAEERRHSEIIRSWVFATRAINPELLEVDCMAQVSKGEVPEPETLADMITYTPIQEFATKVAHRNTGRKLGKERGGSLVMGMAAGDEGLHYEFYNGLAIAAFEIDPDTMVIAASKTVKNFKMPGTGIPGFDEHTTAIANEGIYNLGQYLHEVLEPVLTTWDIEHIEGLSAEAEVAREELFAQVARLGRIVTKMRAREERHAALVQAQG